MQVRKLFAAALLFVSAFGAVGAMAQDGRANPLDIAKVDTHGERSREAVVAELRNVQAQGQWHAAGELGEAPVVATVPQTATRLTREKVKAEVAVARAKHELRVGELL